jgi:hypothetical protein
MPAGVNSGGIQRRVQFGGTTEFSIPASNTGRHVSSRTHSQAPSQAFPRVAHQIPPLILQQFMLSFDAILDKTIQTVLTNLTVSQASVPGFLGASFAQVYSFYSSQSPSLALPPSLVSRVHRLEASLCRKVIARLASLAPVLQPLGPHPVSPPTDATTHLTHSEGHPSPPATPARNPTPSTNHQSPLFFQPRLVFLVPLPPCYYRSIGRSKSGKKWLASLTYKIWHIPWASRQGPTSQPTLQQ